MDLWVAIPIAVIVWAAVYANQQVNREREAQENIRIDLGLPKEDKREAWQRQRSAWPEFKKQQKLNRAKSRQAAKAWRKQNRHNIRNRP